MKKTNPTILLEKDGSQARVEPGSEADAHFRSKGWSPAKSATKAVPVKPVTPPPNETAAERKAREKAEKEAAAKAASGQRNPDDDPDAPPAQ